MKSNKSFHTRYHHLDHLRALTLLSMILYHGTWDLVYLFNVPINWYQKTPGYIWQQSICWVFILLSGFCWNLGHQPWKRGLLIFFAGLGITFVTAVFMPGSIVIFGVLTFLGTAICLTTLLNPLLKRISPIFGTFFMAACFLITRNINKGYLGFESWNFCSLPQEWYQTFPGTFLGFPKAGFFSTDYFSLFPWIFLFLAGYYFYGIMERNQWNHYIEGNPIPLLSWMGRHSLIIYLLHQPLIYGVLSILYQ